MAPFRVWIQWPGGERTYTYFQHIPQMGHVIITPDKHHHRVQDVGWDYGVGGWDKVPELVVVVGAAL